MAKCEDRIEEAISDMELGGRTTGSGAPPPSSQNDRPYATAGAAVFSPTSAVTIIQKVPLYIIAQLAGSILGSGTLALMFEVTPEAYFGTLPAGSNWQSFAIEIVISFLLMFVISGTSTDDRATTTVGPLGGVVTGMTIALNVFVAGYFFFLQPYTHIGIFPNFTYSCINLWENS
ncbi:unnamed protein product [Cuscuta epithymum]|uniref:Uncharacterized protein n=1 Tax=Cuscuta epithymum TaxID=186058 RepID=A0AAV0CWB3_9ASTE|nr:unnamed protein product [Cuscuta epithymum]